MLYAIKKQVLEYITVSGFVSYKSSNYLGNRLQLIRMA